MRLDVLCVGFAVQDMLATVDGYPPADAKVRIQALEEQGGGPAATAAVAIARLGGRVALVAGLGDDERGERILAELAREGVDVSRCIRRRGAHSPLSFVVVDPVRGTRNVFSYSWDVRLGPEAVDARLVRRAKVVLVDVHMPGAGVEAARLARKAGVSVVVDLDTGAPRELQQELLGLADYPIPPLGTASEATGESDPERAALALLRPPARGVVVTMGSEGHIVASEEGVWREPAFPVEAVDTTGAGDAFHGAFALAIARGQGLRNAARFASAVAALKCRRPGGRAGLPMLGEVEGLLRVKVRR